MRRSGDAVTEFFCYGPATALLSACYVPEARVIANPLLVVALQLSLVFDQSVLALQPASSGDFRYYMVARYIADPSRLTDSANTIGNLPHPHHAVTSARQGLPLR
jgi:hypothetical protein